MAEFNDFYRRAIYYDIVFNRDVSPEIDFMEAVYRRHNAGKDLHAILDLACGPGYHARAAAKRGLRAVGLDLRAEMIDFARSHAEAEGVQVEWVAGDMRDVHLSAPVDMAINVFDGIDCLLTNADIIAHLRSIAANLTPGGLYLIDVTHPSHTTPSYYVPFLHTGEREGVRVEVEWATKPPVFDPLTCVFYTRMEMRVDDHGQRTVIEDGAYERVLNAQEIVLLANNACCFEVVDWFGAYDLNQPFDNSEGATRMIAILQKKEA